MVQLEGACMGAWRENQEAAEILSRGATFPKASYRSYVLAALTVLLAVGAAVLLLRHKPQGSRAAEAEVVPASTTAPIIESRAATAAPAASSRGAVEAAQPEIIILPPMILGEKEPAPALVRRGDESCGGTAPALEQARRAEEAAASDPAALEKARMLYQQALDSGGLGDKEDAQCLARLTELTNKIVLDPKTPCSAPAAIFHQVEPGDAVEKIARKYKVNQGQIKRLNQLNDKLMVRYGQTLKILPGPVLLIVNRARLNATLYIDGVFIRRYPVGVGPADATPLGVFTIERKVTNPDWYIEGKRIPFGEPANILGSRWLAIATTDGTARAEGLGIHGTTKPETVPGRESKGCVRMLNKDVEELYDLMPQGGKVQISE
jgi:lipoprotein-anchoring transpeptidase ErfK/SrfK